jgi:NAD dependent epimerase/dehydratase
METIMSGKAFVTGAGGFIGSHLTEALLEKGWYVKALVRYNSRSSWGWLDDMKGRGEKALEVIPGDVTDTHQMRDCVKGCDVVFHLAALIGIPYSYVAPASYVATNITGTLNLAEAALEAEVKRFVHTSTSETYGTARHIPIDEEHPLQAQSPYSATKIAADKIIESFFCAFDLPAVIVRPFNTFGPRQSMRAVIPTIISQALQNKEIHLGSLEPVRDLTYVSDTVAGFIAAAEKEDVAGQVFNLGTGEAVSIGALVQTILEILDVRLPVVTDPMRIRPNKSEVMKLISDNTRAYEKLDWRPEVSLRAGLEQTISWIRTHPDKYEAMEYSI